MTGPRATLQSSTTVQGRIQGGVGGGGSWESGLPRHPNFKKRGKTLHVHVQIHRVLVLNSYPDPSFRNPVSTTAARYAKVNFPM